MPRVAPAIGGPAPDRETTSEYRAAHPHATGTPRTRQEGIAERLSGLIPMVLDEVIHDEPRHTDYARRGRDLTFFRGDSQCAYGGENE